MSQAKRRIAGSVLIFEAIVIVLAVPVAINVADVPSLMAWTVGLGFAAASVGVAARVDLRWGTAAGWMVQAGVIALAVVVPVMALLGAMFAGLWFAALRMVANVEASSEAAENGVPERTGQGVGET